MKKNNNILRSCCLIAGILLGTVVHFIYNIFNPQLTQIQVFMDLWWLSVSGFSLYVMALYGLEEPAKRKGRVPKMRNSPPPGKKASIKDVYEYLETRAESLETIQECSKNEGFPLYININEVYHVLSLYYRGEFGEFLKNHGLCYDHGFGCDADDFDLPEFPAGKSNKLPKYPNPPEPPLSEKKKCEHVWVFSNLSALKVIKGAVPKYHCEKCGECLKT